jgi:hypothetical protein
MPSKAGAVSINTNRGGFGDVIEKSQICFLLSEALAGPCYRRTFTADGLNQEMRINSIYPGPISQITIGQCTLVTEIAFGSLCPARHFAARWSAEAVSAGDAGNTAGARVFSGIVIAALVEGKSGWAVARKLGMARKTRSRADSVVKWMGV